MKVLAFRPRRPSRAEILRLVARRRPALAGMTRRASPAGSRAKVGAAAEAIPPATPGNAGPIGRPAVNRTAHYRTSAPRRRHRKGIRTAVDRQHDKWR